MLHNGEVRERVDDRWAYAQRRACESEDVVFSYIGGGYTKRLVRSSLPPKLGSSILGAEQQDSLARVINEIDGGFDTEWYNSRVFIE